MSNQAFHFSPRPNRAGEIAWQTWGETAFERAREEDKPIVLAISAVWCHWCHVMDETTYSNQDVIAFLNHEFIPVRVDNDQRPDVNARYNMGGWPTTAILTPEGATLTGATYLPPEQMLRMLQQIKEFYRENKATVAERVAKMKSQPAAVQERTNAELRASMVARILEELTENYDPQYGGFGTEPKFPQTDALELLLLEFRITREQRLYDMVAKTMLGMSRGGMYDHVEGGFFRYSTTRDWSVPHFEKMTEDHAGLLRLLAALFLESKNPDFRATLQSATRYVMTTLRDPQTGLFAGSQDADEAYFELPLEERRKIAAPYVDRTSYTNWTAALAGALFAVATALDDETAAARAAQALDALYERMSDADGLLYHFLPPDGTPQVRGLLCDQSAYLRASLDAYQYLGEARFLVRARALAEAMQTTLGAADGGFYDHAALQGELGNLAFKDRPLHDNALVADSFLRLAALTGDSGYRDRAHRILAIYSGTYAKAGSFAASYVRAVRRFLSPESTLVIVGNPAQTADFREAAARLPDPLLCVSTVAAGDDPRAPGAYLCRGTVCAAPAASAAGLAQAYASIT
jgi:uncharacterized protein YyaL (SSP411 family)